MPAQRIGTGGRIRPNECHYARFAAATLILSNPRRCTRLYPTGQDSSVRLALRGPSAALLTAIGPARLEVDAAQLPTSRTAHALDRHTATDPRRRDRAANDRPARSAHRTASTPPGRPRRPARARPADAGALSRTRGSRSMLAGHAPGTAGTPGTLDPCYTPGRDVAARLTLPTHLCRPPAGPTQPAPDRLGPARTYPTRPGPTRQS
jgi:hypothetical protein